MNTKISNNYQLKIGVFILILFFLLSAGFCARKKLSNQIDMAHRLEPSSPQYLMGTDDLGRDLISIVIIGTMLSLTIALTVAIISALIGGFLGIISGLSGGIVDIVIMRVVDLILAFPGILLIIGLVTFLKPGIISIIVILIIPGWVGIARLVRGEVLKFKQQDFIMAAQSYNASFSWIITHHMLPLTFPTIITKIFIDIPGIILAESSINFLGLGMDPAIPTLGQLIDSGRDHLFDRPELIFLPGGILFFIIIAFNFIGEGLKSRVSQ